MNQKNYIFNYALLSYTFIDRNKYILFFEAIIECYVILIESIKFSVFHNLNKSDIKEMNKFYFNKISYLFYIRKLINENGLYPLYLFIIINILLLFYYLYYYLEIFQKLKFVNKIIINFYDKFFFKNFIIVFFDILLNRLVFYWNKININLIYTILIFINVLFLYYTAFKNYKCNYFYFTKFDKNLLFYPFDIINIFYYKYSCQIKLILVILNNLKINNIGYPLYKLLIIILVIYNIVFMILNFLNYIEKPEYYKLQNNIHLLRFFFILLTILFEIEGHLEIFKIKAYYFVIGGSFVIFSLGFIFTFDIDYYITNKLNKLDSQVHLFYILFIKILSENSLIEDYINQIKYHRTICQNCIFCENYSDVIKSIEFHKKLTRKFTVFTPDNIKNESNKLLYYYYRAFLLKFQFEIKNKNKIFDYRNIIGFNLDQIFYDIYYLHINIFLNNSVSFNLRFKICQIYKKYFKTHETVSLNILLLYKQLYENKINQEQIIVDNIKIFILFIDKIKNIINRIIIYVKKDIKTPNNFLQLGKEVEKLRNKENYNFLKFKLNNNDYYLDILSYILEEITNVLINKEKGSFKDILNMGEEYLSNCFLTNKDILITFNPNNQKFIIRKAGKDLYNYIGEDLLLLFPKEFRNEGLRLLYKSLNSSKTLKTFEFIIHSKSKNQNEEKESEINIFEKGFYQRINIRFKLIFDKFENSNEFFLNGNFVIGIDELIITKKINESNQPLFSIHHEEKEKNIEYLYKISIRNFFENFQEENNEKGKNLINDKIFNKKNSFSDSTKLSDIFNKINDREIEFENKIFSFLFSIHTENYEYIIYSSHNNMKRKKINENDEYEEEEFDENLSMKFADNVSMASVQSQNSINKNGVEKEKKYNLPPSELKYRTYQKRFSSITKFSFILCIIIIIFCIISLIIELQKNKELLESYSVYTELRALNRLFYNLVTSILAVNCIGIPGKEGCINYYKLYMEKFNKENNLTYPSFYFSIFENILKVKDYEKQLIALKTQIFRLNDPIVNKNFNEPFNFTLLSYDGNLLTTSNLTTTFVGGLEILVNSFTIITQSGKYETNPVYIITLKDSSKYDFSNILDPSSLEEWQFKYYNLIINYQKYLNTWVNIQFNCGENTNQRLKNLNIIVILFLSIFFIFHIFLTFLVFYYIFSFETLFILSMNKIMQKFNSNEFTDFFIKKYQNLKIMIKFYEKNPILIFHNIEKIYSEYKKITHLHHKLEHDKKSNNHNSEQEKLLEKEKEINYFEKNEYRIITSIYYMIIIGILFYYIILYLTFLLFWIKKKNIILEVFDIITDNTIAACSGYNMFALCQLMILGNITQAEISKNMQYEGDNYIIDESLRSNYLIQSLSKRSDSVGGIIKNSNEFISFNCNNFFTEINDNKFNSIEKEYPNFKFKDLFPDFCETFKILEYNEDTIFYKPIFYEIIKFIKSLTKRNYDYYLNILENGNLFYMCDLQFLIYRPFRTWYNNIIYGHAINNSLSTEKNILYSSIFFTIGSEIVIFMILYILIFAKINVINKTLTGVKNVFKFVY